MKLSLVIEQLRANAPTFLSRVAGAAEYKNLNKRSNMQTPSAYVIPLDDDPGNQQTKNTYRQTVSDGFSVVVILSNQDERGQVAYDNLHAIRAELWLALLGWEPDENYDAIEYDGGSLVGLDRSRLDYQFEFHADIEVDASMTWQGADLEQKPAFKSVHIDLDHSELPPDGNIDHEANFTIEQ